MRAHTYAKMRFFVQYLEDGRCVEIMDALRGKSASLTTPELPQSRDAPNLEGAPDLEGVQDRWHLRYLAHDVLGEDWLSKPYGECNPTRIHLHMSRDCH